MTRIIPAQTAVGFDARRGQVLRIVDVEGGQVCDLVAFRLDDLTEWISNGRSFDYGSKILFTAGDVLYSNKSAPMLRIVRDDVGRHDFLFTACSPEMFRIQYGVTGHHPNCLQNLTAALAGKGVREHLMPTPFNVFQNSTVKSDGQIVIKPPLWKAGDAVEFLVEMDMSIGLSACSASLCNGGHPKAIGYELL